MSPESQVPSPESTSPHSLGRGPGDPDPGPGIPHSGLQARNAAILRRTLSAVSWLYALWSGLLGFMAMAVGGSEVAINPRFILLHAAVLGLAGTLQWHPRRGALLCTALAAAGSIGFVILDLRRGSAAAALADGGYVLVAAVLLYNSRPRT